MSKILIYPHNRRRPPRSEQAEAAHFDAADDRFMGLGWFIAAVGLLCMLSAMALATLNLP